MRRDANTIDTSDQDVPAARGLVGGATKCSPKSFASMTRHPPVYKMCRLISMLMHRSGSFKAPLAVYYESAYLRG